MGEDNLLFYSFTGSRFLKWKQKVFIIHDAIKIS